MNEIIVNDNKFICISSLTKKINNWLKTCNGKKIIAKITDSDKIEKIKKGKETYFNIIIITIFCCFSDVNFIFKTAKWIEKWKCLSKTNNEEYYNKIYDTTISFESKTEKIQKERLITLQVQKLIGGKIGIECESGIIDLLTNTKIIEIKTFRNWKHALGQILIYGLYYPNHKKYIYLFDVPKDEIDKINNIKKMTQIWDVKTKVIIWK